MSGSRPSPGADDPRIQYLYDELGYMLKKEALDELPAALDEIDHAAGVVRVDTRDEAIAALIRRACSDPKQFAARTFDDATYELLTEWQTRAVLAALRGEQ